MIIGNQDYVDRSLQPRAAWAQVWHLMDRHRSAAIDYESARLRKGRRRHDGRHWIYKKLIEY